MQVRAWRAATSCKKLAVRFVSCPLLLAPRNYGTDIGLFTSFKIDKFSFWCNSSNILLILFCSTTNLLFNCQQVVNEWFYLSLYCFQGWRLTIKYMWLWFFTLVLLVSLFFFPVNQWVLEKHTPFDCWLSCINTSRPINICIWWLNKIWICRKKTSLTW